MKKFYILLFSFLFGIDSDISVTEIIKKIDFNLNSKNRFMKSKMIIHGRRVSRTILSESWVV